VRSLFGLKFAICFALVAITFAVFGQTIGYGFVNYDDPSYASDNPQIQAGLNARSIVWAFTHIHSNNWHPLTTMSHMLDWQLFGKNAGPHHLENVIIHSANAVLLFLLLLGATGRLWSSGFVAGVFAIHPLHVESVAWISERKDMLSGFFFFLTLLAYVQYTKNRTAARYATMSILFALGLLCKPMLVTLPAILLLLDYWPLRRFETSPARSLLVEKIPLVVLSIGSALVTLIVQNAGAVGLVRLEVLPVSARVANALSAIFVYIRQMFWPADLALAYNHPRAVALSQVAILSAAFLVLTLGVFLLRKRRPYLLMGWGWYLIMLLPVLGLVQVGGQAHADRYTYLPQIGLLIAIVWTIVDLMERARYRVPVLATAAIIIMSALAVRASGQVGYWRDSETLWQHAVAVTNSSDMAHLGLARAYTTEARLNDAIREYKAALALGPNSDVETALGSLLLEQGRTEEAIDCYRRVVQMNPSSALAHYNLAVSLHRLGRFADAIAHYQEALRLDPNYPDAKEFLDQALSESAQSGDPRFRPKKP
jgi:protein O-mannosyl-transferase